MLYLLKKIVRYTKKITRKWFSNYIEIETQKKLRNHILKRYDNIINNYKYSTKPKAVFGSYKIWFMWWQGEEYMPDVIKINYKSLLKNQNGNEVIFISKDSYHAYVEIPEFILEKQRNNELSVTHLSDIIRVSLLADHGGLWLDASVYVNNLLPVEFKYPYWTTKWKLSSHEKTLYPLWVGFWSISSIPKLDITQCIGVWYSSPNNPIFLCLKEFWFSYLKQENKVVYYWLTELFLIGCMYDRIPSVKSQVDDVPLNNSNIFKIRQHINNPYDANLFQEMTQDTFLFYLSWKVQYREIENNTGISTLYQRLKFQSENFVRD